MTSRSISALRAILLMALVALAATSAQAQSQTQAGDGAANPRPERPVYLDILPVADAENSILPDDDVVAMAREALSGARKATIRMGGQTLPANVRVLRIMYIVHQQPEEDGMTLAASASTELLRTQAGDDGVMQTYSIYNGLQQTLVQGPNLERARAQLRGAFRKELQARIASAFDESSAAD